MYKSWVFFFLYDNWSLWMNYIKKRGQFRHVYIYKIAHQLWKRVLAIFPGQNTKPFRFFSDHLRSTGKNKQIINLKPTKLNIKCSQPRLKIGGEGTFSTILCTTYFRRGSNKYTCSTIQNNYYFYLTQRKQYIKYHSVHYVFLLYKEEAV